MTYIAFYVPQVIILSHQRSGTHFLQSCLASHPDICGRGECFLRYQRYLTARSVQVVLDSDRRLFDNQPNQINIGILMYGLVDWFEARFGDLGNYKIIHLLRNPLAIANSEVQKQTNRQYYRGNYSSHYRVSDVPPQHQPFDRQVAHDMVPDIFAKQASSSAKIHSYCNLLTINYELLTDNQHTTCLSESASSLLLTFLGLETRQLSTTLLKTGTI